MSVAWCASTINKKPTVWWALFLLLAKACRLEVYEVSLCEAFDAGDVVVYPVWRLQLGYLLLVHADRMDHVDELLRGDHDGVALYLHGFDDVVKQLPSLEGIAVCFR
ncbi:hypothetical protein [Marinomonas primoryensis]|jgi:hypothetical protein|uniref:hypothetical protein n=1 Tax=Marinomonas primoryensis TaxID=178399 RepID=UPI003703EC4A